MSLAALALMLSLQDAPIFEEKFAGKLSDGWTWLREDAAGWKLEGGGLRIKAQPGTIWYKKNDAKNILLRKSPVLGTEAAPISIEVTTDNAPEANAEQCGLLLYIDDSNYLKIIRECNKGKPGIVFAREQKGIPESLPPKEESSSKVQLKLVWSGAKVSGAYKAGGDWIAMGEYDVPEGDLKIALACHGAPTTADRWATFTSLRVTKAAK
ncbi:MAG TPA: DUF1349 domain-containing protein [Planctomycetota bacterium]|nr:DUF1349 domain-containing protein [Planctomycetota bacterium]